MVTLADTSLITWEERKKISETLINEAKDFSDELLINFGKTSGIYVLIYCGNELGGTLWHEPTPQIIYVGHNSTDSNRHWLNNTGISTVRRSLAAMLNPFLHLQPIANSPDPEDKDRFTNYKLTPESEENLTAWMNKNIKISFLDLPTDKVENYYLSLIDYNAPMFNFQNNPRNSFGSQIKAYRLQMAEKAAQNDL